MSAIAAAAVRLPPRTPVPQMTNTLQPIPPGVHACLVCLSATLRISFFDFLYCFTSSIAPPSRILAQQFLAYFASRHISSRPAQWPRLCQSPQIPGFLPENVFESPAAPCPASPPHCAPRVGSLHHRPDRKTRLPRCAVPDPSRFRCSAEIVP